MFLYPFRTIWLKAGNDRTDLAEKIRQQTYLSDAGYRKSDNMTKIFYGLVNENEFVLENIGNKRIPQFFEGDIVGVGEETYVKIRMGALKHIRMYVLYGLLLLTGLIFWLRGLLGVDTVDANIMYAFTGIVIILFGYGYFFTMQFQRKLSPGIEFFRGLLSADRVSEDEVPAIFKR